MNFPFVYLLYIYVCVLPTWHAETEARLPSQHRVWTSWGSFCYLVLRISIPHTLGQSPSPTLHSNSTLPIFYLLSSPSDTCFSLSSMIYLHSHYTYVCTKYQLRVSIELIIRSIYIEVN